MGQQHPFLEEVSRDLVALCHHPDAGKFVLLGWRPKGRPLSFPVENGAHAGPGYEETRAFALLPADAPLRRHGRRYLRASDLREAALHVLGRAPLPETARPPRPLKRRNTLRVMTYNVHSCIGMDGRLSTSRIARIIAQCRPDVVALQELDVGRGRTGGIDQAHAIAQELEMEFHFFPGPPLGRRALWRCHPQPLADEADQGRPAADARQPPGPGAARRVVGQRVDRGSGAATGEYAPGPAVQGAAAASASLTRQGLAGPRRLPRPRRSVRRLQRHSRLDRLSPAAVARCRTPSWP